MANTHYKAIHPTNVIVYQNLGGMDPKNLYADGDSNITRPVSAVRQHLRTLSINEKITLKIMQFSKLNISYSFSGGPFQSYFYQTLY